MEPCSCSKSPTPLRSQVVAFATRLRPVATRCGTPRHPRLCGETLCIPTIFISYTGYALDNKMPLLKALSAVDAAATSVCQYFDKNITKVNATLGWEQEYFLVDKALYAARPDLAMTGRALFGAAPAKGQQLDDHYFGAIPERVSAFMKDFEMEAHKLGIPVTTRHNEVAPNQFELAPVFEEANLANDHNLLLMELLEKVARRHDFRILLHEKPFAGVNGSGKHNNWSLGTNTGVNLLKPGNNPKTNLRFLTFFVNTLAALHRHADVVRASIASVGNDHRLGANEAPPAIMSAFIGSQLTELLDALEASIKAGKLTPADKTALKLEIGRIPEVLLDNTDRNRTSPFAFTGNKFELRAAGSTANCAVPMTVLNTIVAEQLNAFKAAVDARIKGGDKKDDALLKELQKLIKEHKAIRFEGNGYGDEWVKEAKKRGLSNLTDTPTALQVWGRKEVAELFSSLGVLTTEELHARQEVEYENYIMKRQIEARIAGDMATNIVLPAAIAYQNMLIENISGLTDVFGKDAKAMTAGQREVLAEVSECVSKLHTSASSLRSERSKINKMDDIAKRAVKYGSVVTPLIEEVGQPLRPPGAIGGQRDLALAQIPGNVVHALRTRHGLLGRFTIGCSRNGKGVSTGGRLFSVLSHPDSPSLFRNAYQPASIRGPLQCHNSLLFVRRSRSVCPERHDVRSRPSV